MCWLLLSSFSLRIICMLQQQQQHIRMFIIIVFIFLSFKWFNLIRRVIKNHSAKVRRNPHSRNTLCMAFLYTIRLVCPPVDYKQSLSPCLCVYQTTACGLRSLRRRGSKVPPPWVEALGFKGRRYGLRGAWGLSLRVMGIVPLPPKGCFASPIGGIGVPP